MSASRPREWLTRTLVSCDDFRYLRTTRCSVGGNLVVEERRGRREGGRVFRCVDGTRMFAGRPVLFARG